METILVADQQQIIRMGIRTIIETQPQQFIIIEATTCTEVMQILSTQQVRYAILDMFLADGNIFSAMHKFIDHAQVTNILVYAMNEKLYARRLMQKGIRGFVSKRASVEELNDAIHCLFKGEMYVSEDMKAQLFKPVKADLFENMLDSLSDRELEVVEYVVMGMGPTEIAQKMTLDVTTISTYRRRAFDKLGVHNLIELKDKFQLFKMLG
jgi:two-component system invasion response regulator UvrY